MIVPFSEILSHGHWLPLIFTILMGVAVLVYVILDGYDLGVGILLSGANSYEKDKMIASIGPFWDANETWLVLGVGILLVAFPAAHGIILSSLYLPTALMLIGLILRGVAFDFRVKVDARYKTYWNWTFFMGSCVTALCQGYMLGSYIVGFDQSFNSVIFSLLTGVCLMAGYAFVGSSLLVNYENGRVTSKESNRMGPVGFVGDSPWHDFGITDDPFHQSANFCKMVSVAGFLIFVTNPVDNRRAYFDPSYNP